MKNDVDETDPLSYDGPEITNCQVHVKPILRNAKLSESFRTVEKI